MAKKEALKKFEVDLHYNAIITANILARNKDEAIKKAIELNGAYLGEYDDEPQEVPLSYTEVNEVKEFSCGGADDDPDSDDEDDDF